jgi:hypothetical protein
MVMGAVATEEAMSAVATEEAMSAVATEEAMSAVATGVEGDAEDAVGVEDTNNTQLVS